MHRAALIQVTSIWAISVYAFFPYIPGYACSEYHGCEGLSEKALPADGATIKEAESAELLTFKLSQRGAGNYHPAPAAAAARQAERLRRRYGFGFVGVPATLSSTVKDSEKRDNNFAIVEAATPTAANSVGIDQDGSDISYFVEASVGAGGDALYLLCDTGAGSTWIMASDCESTACQDHTTWRSSGSATYSETGTGFSISYGSGSVEGYLAKDTVAIGSIKVTMEFGLANTTSDDFAHFAFDGILGLSMATGASNNFLSIIKADQLLKSNVFSVDLDRTSDGPNTGQLTFGGMDSSKFTGDISYTSVNTDAGGDWAIPLGDVGFDGSNAGVTTRLAYIDTGTTYAFAPAEDVAALHKLIPGAQSIDGVTYTAPCDTEKPITVTFSGVDYEISVKDWLSSPSSSDICTSNIYGHEVVSGAWLLGDVFLKNVYAVFDADALQIGFAIKAASTTTSMTTSVSTSAASTSTTPSTISRSNGSISGNTGVTVSVIPTASAGTIGPSQSTAVSVSTGHKQCISYRSRLCIIAAISMLMFHY